MWYQWMITGVKLSKGHVLEHEITGDEVWIDKVVQNDG